MKYQSLFFVIITVMLIASLAAAAEPYYDTSIPKISASAESISPYPVEPGQDFTVQLRVYNDGAAIAKDVAVEAVPSDIFFLRAKDDDFNIPFTLCARHCSKENIYYYIVSQDAKSGEYPITFKIREDNRIHEEKIFIKVIGKPDIIFDAKLLNDSISPDESFDIELTIRNVGTGAARNIKIAPIATDFVMENSNLVFIKTLQPDTYITKRLNFMVSDEANPGPHKVIFSLDYKDEKSVEYSLQQALGIKLLNKVKLDIASVIVEPQPVVLGQQTLVTVRVENLGEGAAENIHVSLRSSGMEGQTKAYIGKLDEGEDAPAIFA
ncbi:MAG: COG1361 S-layer family protein, partial [Candidatus Heimdallarchaeota archaeon]|nr:COG1361 S-layer family protein [Candidatus Heimdallarchaeota archaeon]